jgi:hypothetical protein
MDCVTLKPKTNCVFMTKKGCSFNGGGCHKILEQCNGCDRASQFETGWYCSACPDPSVKWKIGKCNLATHVKAEAVASAKVNPLKASKRAAR